MKRLTDIGVLGVGIWSGDVVTNDAFPESMKAAPAADPFKGRRGDDGSIQIAGMHFSHPKWTRTIGAIERAFVDPFRGTRRRRYFPKDCRSSDAEASAAKLAIADAGIDVGDLDALIVQSFLPDEIQPANFALVAHKLGFTRGPSWGVDSICNSPVSQLQFAASFIAAGQAERVLCVHSAAYSRVQDPGSTTSFQDGDMAAAFVVGPSNGTTIDCSWRTDGRLHAAIKLAWLTPSHASRAYWQPSTERLMYTWRDDLQVEVMGELEKNAVTVCEEATKRAGFALSDVDLFISHHPNAWFGEFMSDALGLPNGVVFDTFEEYGVINSATLTCSLHEARRAGRTPKGARVLLFGPGAGYTYGPAAVRW